MRRPTSTQATLRDSRTQSEGGRGVGLLYRSGFVYWRAVELTDEGHLIVESGAVRRTVMAGDVVHLRHQDGLGAIESRPSTRKVPHLSPVPSTREGPSSSVPSIWHLDGPTCGTDPPHDRRIAGHARAGDRGAGFGFPNTSATGSLTPRRHDRRIRLAHVRGEPTEPVGRDRPDQFVHGDVCDLGLVERTLNTYAIELIVNFRRRITQQPGGDRPGAVLPYKCDRHQTMLEAARRASTAEVPSHLDV